MSDLTDGLEELDLGRFERALKCFLSAIDTAQPLEERAQTLTLMAQALLELGRIDEALSRCDEAMPVAVQLEAFPLEARITAIRTRCDQARTISRDSDDEPQGSLFEQTLQKAVLACQSGNPAGALMLLRLQPTTSALERAWSLGFQARALWQLGRNAEAVAAVKEARACALEAEDAEAVSAFELLLAKGPGE